MNLLAQLRNPVLPGTLGGGTSPNISAGGTATGSIISALIGGMFIVAFITAMFYLVTGAIMWITSEGEKTNLESARRKIIHAIIGLLVVGASWAIMTLVADFFGLDFTKLPIPSFGGTTQSFGGVGNKLR